MTTVTLANSAQFDDAETGRFFTLVTFVSGNRSDPSLLVRLPA